MAKKEIVQGSLTMNVHGSTEGIQTLFDAVKELISKHNTVHAETVTTTIHTDYQHF